MFIQLFQNRKTALLLVLGLGISLSLLFQNCAGEFSLAGLAVNNSSNFLANQNHTIQDGAPNGTTIATGVVTDSIGNFYVSGSTNVAIDGQTMIGNEDFFITKYGPTGARIWTIQDGSPSISGNTRAQGIAVDSSGNIYVAGATGGALDGQSQHGLYDFFVSKYNSSGVRQWTVQDGVTSGKSYALAITADSSGNSYITGFTDSGLDGQSLQGVQDLFVTKYNSTGARQWTVQDGNSGGICGSFLGYSYLVNGGIALDSGGNVYVAGSTQVGLDGQSMHGVLDSFLIKYSNSGSHQWTVLDGVTQGNIYANSLAIDSSGNLFVGGYTNVGLDLQSLHGLEDYFVSKYSSSGSRLWTFQDGISSGSSLGYAVGVDSFGNVSIAGTTNLAIDGLIQSGSNDLFLTQLNSNGTRNWTIQDGSPTGTTIPNALVTTSARNIIVAGRTSKALDGKIQIGLTDAVISIYNSSGSLQ